MVSHRWDLVGSLKHQHDIAIVTENQTDVAKFRRHKLRVHFQLPYDDNNKRNIESFLMVSEQLPNLCNFLQYLLYLVPNPCSYIAHLRGTPPHECITAKDPEAGDDRGPSIKLQLQDKVEQKTANLLLDHFKNVISANLNAKVLNRCTALDTYANSLERRMNTRVIWTNAMAWHAPATLSGMKYHADDVLHDRNLIGAMIRYAGIWMLFPSLPILHFRTEMWDSEAAQPLGIMSSVIVMAAITDTLIRIRLGIIDARLTTRRLTIIQSLADKVGLLPKPEASATQIPYGVVTWHSIVCRFLFRRTPQNLETVLAEIRDLLKRLDKGKFGDGHRKYVEADLKFIEQCARSRGRVLPSPSEFYPILTIFTGSQGLSKLRCIDIEDALQIFRGWTPRLHDLEHPTA